MCATVVPRPKNSRSYSRHLVLLFVVIFFALLPLGASAQWVVKTDDDDKKKMLKIVDLIESAMSTPVVGGKKGCLDVKLKDLLKNPFPAGGVDPNVSYEKTTVKKGGEEVEVDTTVKHALDHLRKLINDDRIRFSCEYKWAATYLVEGTDADLILIHDELWTKVCGFFVGPSFNKTAYKMQFIRSIVNELIHVFQIPNGTYPVHCDAERDSDTFSLKVLCRLLDSLEAAPCVPHVNVAGVNADAQTVPGFGKFLTGCGAGAAAEIAKVHQYIKNSKKELTTRLNDIFNPPLAAGTANRAKWGNYYKNLPRSPLAFPKKAAARDGVSIEDVNGTVHQYLVPSGSVTQAMAFLNEQEELTLVVSTYSLTGSQLHFWKDTDGDLVPEPALATPSLNLPGVFGLDPDLDGVGIYDSLPEVFTLGGIGQGLLLTNEESGEITAVELGPDGLPNAAVPFVVYQDPCLTAAGGYVFWQDIYELNPGEVTFVFSTIPSSMRHGWAPVVAIAGQGACPGGWCIAAPGPCFVGQNVAQVKPQTDPAMRNSSGLCSGFLETDANPGDATTVRSLSNGSLIFGMGGTNNLGAGLIIGPASGFPCDNNLIRIETASGATDYYLPDYGHMIGKLGATDINGDSADDTLILTQDPPRLHFSRGNPGGSAEERNHLYELILEEDDESRLTTIDFWGPTGGRLLRPDGEEKDLTLLPGSSPPLYVQSIEDLDGDSNPDESVLIRKDQGQPFFVIEVINQVNSFPFPSQIFQLPLDFIPHSYQLVDYDLDLDLDCCIRALEGLSIILVNDGAGVFNPLGGPLYLGTNEDFVQLVDVNGDAPSCSGIVEPAAGDVVNIFGFSPNGTFDFEPFAILAQFFTPGLPPAGIPSLGLAVSPGGVPGPFALINGNAGSPLGPNEVVQPGGNLHSFLIPPGLSGLSLMVQSIALSPIAGNTFFAAGFGTEVRFQ
ncbi:MAG: hypothetical protein V3W41_17375 [Planctomycetota bacterium]